MAKTDEKQNKTMDDDISVRVTDLSKIFKIYASPNEKLKEFLLPFKKKYHQEFHALQNVSFELKKGESIGILGVNGSGKSTLLQLLCRILPPSKGEIEINGKIAALIALGAGFNPHFTGRENVYVNGTLMGFSKKEMDEKFSQIEDFADIGDFIDRSVRTYSSGMYIRLAFACAVHVDPDILIIDEVLAVGDFKFRQKCAQKINEIKKKATIILVSHNIRDILMLCSRAIVLDKGKVLFQGNAEDSANFYADLINMEELKKIKTKKQPINPDTRSEETIYGVMCNNKNEISELTHQWIDKTGRAVHKIAHGERIALEFSFRLNTPRSNLIIGVPIYNSSGELVTGISTDMGHLKIKPLKNGIVKGKLIIDKFLFNPGQYTPILAISENTNFLYRNFINELIVERLPFSFGIATPDYTWEFDDIFLE